MNKKNAVVIPVYNSLLSSKEYEICVKTWEIYCKKFNIELHLLKGEKYFNDKPDYAAMCYDRWLDIIFDPSEYDRITFVDADTMIRWDAFDLNEVFKDNNIEIAVVHDQGGRGIARHHFNQWLGFKPDLYSFVKGYFNAGFVSMKAIHLQELQKSFSSYKEYYYNEKDINCHVEGIGKIGGVRIDGMDQTAINLALQELFTDKVTFVSNIFNRQASYIYPGDNNWIFWEDWDKFVEKMSTFEFLNEAILFHLGGILLSRENLMELFWENFKNKYE
jgi:hypothetical protein